MLCVWVRISFCMIQWPAQPHSYYSCWQIDSTVTLKHAAIMLLWQRVILRLPATLLILDVRVYYRTIWIHIYNTSTFRIIKIKFALCESVRMLIDAQHTHLFGGAGPKEQSAASSFIRYSPYRQAPCWSDAMRMSDDGTNTQTNQPCSNGKLLRAANLAATQKSENIAVIWKQMSYTKASYST